MGQKADVARREEKEVRRERNEWREGDAG